MLEADNLIILGRPVYAVPALAIAEEAAELINAQLGRLQIEHGDGAPCFHLHVNIDLSMFVTGAGKQCKRQLGGADESHLDTPCKKCKSNAAGAHQGPILIQREECVNSDSLGAEVLGPDVLFTVDSCAQTPLSECLTWLFNKITGQRVSTQDFIAHMHPRVWCWLRQALHWSYAVAGNSLHLLAEQAGVETDDFVTCVAEEHTTDPFAMTYIEAVACILRLNVAMLDASGDRCDGFWRVKSYGIQHIHGLWAVIGPLGLPPQHYISPTLPFAEGSSCSTEHVWQVLPYSDVTPEPPLHVGARGAHRLAAADSLLSWQ
eukprot:4810713-Amphidinium_carterae.2